MAQCISQIRVKNGDGSFADVPCSKCGMCLQNRRKEWSFRLQKEWRYHADASFITLTYTDEELVFGTCDRGNVYPVLHKRDFQLFMKRLRKRQAQIGPNKIKYYGVGEYGEKTGRPHYHAIVFGMYPALREELPEIWSLGHTHAGNVSLDSIDYVTKYVVNRVEKKHYLVPPFSSISNGIGLQHLEDNSSRYHSETVVKNNRGFNQKLPRYYRNKLGRNRWIDKIRVERDRPKFDEAWKQEYQRLKKLGHEEPIQYMDERSLAASDRVLKSSKEGGQF